MSALTSEVGRRGLHTITVAVGGTGDAFCVRRRLVHLRTLHHLPLGERHPGWLDEMVAAEHPGYRLIGTERIARQAATTPCRAMC
ncbi:hypothetical protein ACGFNU_27290 [Spirillospora sp. NPDC048911]|uniref:hypothetical protein n=1 Tax=Spirillospora sp. NPDC048911 TaxID=3364527 RepID=UPI0037186E41